jgi:hypothetical protein
LHVPDYMALYDVSLLDVRLDELENLMVISYVGSGFTFINSIVKNGEIKFGGKLIEVMDRGLAKLPNYEGVVYEGNKSVKPNQFKRGSVILFNQYLSTSKFVQTPMDFARPHGTIFKIHVKNGKDLSASYNPYEAEVLMPRGSMFKVIGRTEEEGIEMIELVQLGNFPSKPKPRIERFFDYLHAKRDAFWGKK